mgnify:CR=1 FL=1
MEYNGHKNWARWNVDHCRTLDEAAAKTYRTLWGLAPLGEKPHTPDGAPYTVTSIRAALVGWKD